MGYEKLFEGYKRIINGIYSPRTYYERVKAVSQGVQAPGKETLALSFPLRFGITFAISTPRSGRFLVLGIKDNARLYYWKLLLWSLVRRPRLLPMAMTYHVYGFHFRKVFAVGR